MADVYHDGVITDAAVFAPNLFVKAFLADDFIRIFHQIGQQQEFPSGQADFFSVFIGPSAFRIQGKKAGFQQGGISVRRRFLVLLPPQLRLDAEYDLTGAEGLGNIIVAAAGKTEDFIDIIISGG